MGTIKIIGWFFALLFAEALNDGLVHRFKVEKKIIYGYGHHAAQLLLIIVAACTGVYVAYDIIKYHGLISQNFGFALLTYTMIRIAFFNIIYNTIAGHSTNTIGNTDIFDVALKWLMYKVGQFLSWVCSLFKIKFDARIVVMLFNTVKIGLAFYACILIDKYVATY